MSSLVIGGIELASSSQSSSHMYPEFCRASSNVNRQSSNVKRPTSSGWGGVRVGHRVAIGIGGVLQKAKKIAWVFFLVWSLVCRGDLSICQKNRQMYIVPETPECLVNFVPSQKQRQWKDYEFRTAG